MSALGGAAVSGATLDAPTRVNALLRSEEYRRHRAVHLRRHLQRDEVVQGLAPPVPDTWTLAGVAYA